MYGRKAVICLIISVLIAGILNACARNADNETSPDSPSGNPITTSTDYVVKLIPLPDDFIAHRAIFTDDRIYLSNSTRVVELDFNGNEKSRTVLTVTERFNLVGLADDGGYWAIRLKNDKHNQQKVESIHIARFNKDGEELERITADGSQFGLNEPVVFPNRFMVDGDYIFIMSYHATYIIDKSGQLIMEINAAGDIPKGNVDAVFTSLFTLKDGRICLSSFIHNNQTGHQSMILLIPDMDMKDIEEINVMSTGGEIDTFFISGRSGDALIGTRTEFQDFNIKTGEFNLVIDCLRYGIDVANMAGAAVLSDGSIIVAERAGREMIERIAVHIPIDASDDIIAKYGAAEDEAIYEEPIEKQIVTLSTLRIDDYLSNLIFNFNRDNKYYAIEIWDYSNSTFNFDEDEALTRFHTDILAGKIADINVVPFMRPSNIYINQGMYVDLKEFMDKDPDFNKADYIPGLFEAMEVDGKIFELFPYFMDYIMMGKKADVGDTIGWTLDEFAAFLDIKPDSKYIIGGCNKRDFILMMIQNEFINPHTGEAHFDRDVFAKILTVAEHFPNESSEGNHEFNEGAKDGNPLLLDARIGKAFEVISRELQYFQEEVTIKGFPSSRGNGLYFEPWLYFGITTKAENPEGAWEFIKYSMDTYDSMAGLNFFTPVKLSVIDEYVEWQKSRFNEKVLGRNFFESIPYSNFIDREYYIQKIDEGAAIIKQEIRMVRRHNNIITNIILEELESYLGGQKSADAMIDVIESRLWIYFAELQ